MSTVVSERLDLIRRIQALPEGDRLPLEMKAVQPYFDPEFYRSYVRGTPTDAQLLRYFCEQGWRSPSFRPAARFNSWWYRLTQMEGISPDTNPLLHYALIGQELDLPTAPACGKPLPSAALPTDRPIRRACLFASYESDGRVSAATRLYLEELARHADVFYWCDAELQPAELASLEPLVRMARARRHGAYDFGSYAALAAEIGWETLAAYDEVLFVNDSCFLLGPLDDVFATMAATSCDWWAMQATEVMAAPLVAPTHLVRSGDRQVRVLTAPIAITQGEGALAEMFDHPTDFHLGSYFVAFRRPVVIDELFRRLVGRIQPEESKFDVVHKYEVGLSQLLIGAGHRFATFIPDLYPFHPVVGPTAFDLIERGLPLLKRSLFTENLFGIKDLHRYRWKVRPFFPDAPFELIDAVAR